MAETVPTQLHDLAALEEVSLAMWRRLADAFGYPAGLTHDTISAIGVHQRLAAGMGFPAALAEVLDRVFDLGTEDGCEALRDQARSLGIIIEQLEDEGPRDFAARLCLERREREELQRLLDCAQAVTILKGRSRTYREYAGKVTRAVDGPQAKCPTLVAAIAAWCRNNGRSDYCRVSAYERGNELHFHVVHAHHLEAPSTVNEGKHQVVKFRRVQHDLVRYDVATGRLMVSSGTARMAPELRRIFGEALFNDALFFREVKACSLELIQRRDAQEALNRHRVPDIIDVRLIAAKLKTKSQRVDATFRTARTDDLLEEAEAVAAVQSGVLRSATLAIEFNRKRGTRVVQLEPPLKFSVTQDETAPLVHEYLRQVGITQPAAERRGDLWTLGPGVHSAEAWKRVLGPATTESMRAQGVLFNAPRRAVPYSVLEAGGPELEVTGTLTGDLVGVNEDSETPSRVLTRTEVDGLGFDLPRFAAMLAMMLQLEGPVGDPDPEGLVELGELKVGSRNIAVFLMGRSHSQPALLQPRIDAIRRRNGLEPVLLIPKGRTPRTGIVEVEFDWLGLNAGDLLHALTCAFGLEGEVEAVRLAPPDTGLIVDARRFKIWIHGVEVELGDTQPFRYVHELATAAGRPVEKGEMKACLSKSSDESLIPKAKNDLKKKVNAAFEKVGRTAPEFDEMFQGRGSYFTTLKCFVSPRSTTPAVASIMA